MRIARALAQAGIASRRHAEDLIRGGVVTVNGKAVTALGLKVDTAVDDVRVNGHPVATRPRTYLLLHKPRGYVSTRSDEEGRPAVIDLLPPKLRHVYPVGRLDIQSEGLLLLTDDGDFCLRMTHPRYGARKVYRAKVRGTPSSESLERLTRGIASEGERLRVREARVVAPGDSSAWVEVVMDEGKKNEIRRLCAAIGHPCVRLQRTAIEFLTLEGLAPGRFRTLRPGEVRRLLASWPRDAAARNGADPRRAPAGNGAPRGPYRAPRRTG
ncbi:MAG: pseudouridine synthase [Acidobacteriota bacterium]